MWYRALWSPQQEQGTGQLSYLPHPRAWTTPILLVAEQLITWPVFIKLLMCVGIISFITILILFWQPGELVSAAAGSWERLCFPP